ncbi:MULTISPECIES: polysaccharide lyase 6 family protein [unclassified Pseudoalteromonas]|uniref:polysaccharide lyase 6 family protein n=1 Tax=unclassified Pseudoalteromonas TaxID=194690 RepID=UPI0025B3E1FB|nr:MULTISPECIES: polysaccharide lyase 6 family protein [unclassified Pseudoalteromonas]MDN3379769.1 polysaccharide lyase 6 family protein [Pseudoalteromonas sp. APC 3893]MDN3388105.1 polysaccharide lyase 6 family protein [Pseudoalteromonas sp. APC 4017]
MSISPKRNSATRKFFITSLALASALSSHILLAKTYLVSDADEYSKVAKSLAAGDVVQLKDGTWNDFEILFSGQGSKNKPITLEAQTSGKVILSGLSNLRLAGEHLVVKGLVFKDGYTPTGAVISFRRNKKEYANNSRVTEVVIDNYSNPDKQESDYWVALYGKNNRFDHSYLAGKRNKGVTMAVRLDSEQSQQNNHSIDHNYFGPRPVFGSNGGETLRIGTSHYSLTDSLTVVENNYFERCDGEVEIISVKSGKNKLRNNTFFESRGTLTLRHGNGNIVENNVFFGNGVDHTGGIRVINKDQIVRNNYLEGLTGYRFGSGLTVMNGVPNSTINRYHQVDNATIENNTLVNVSHVQLAAGSDQERSAVPVNSVMRDNLIYNDKATDVFTAFDDISGIKFSNNLLNKSVEPLTDSGFITKKVTMQRANNGLMYPQSSAKKYGISADLEPTVKSQTGPSWYEKKPTFTEFDSGESKLVNSAEGALFSAISDAKDGDILVLQPGKYNLMKIANIDKTLTLRAQKMGSVELSFSRSTLFEINNGGSLKLVGITISGKNSPDSTGNTAIRTAKWGMYVNYRLMLDTVKVTDLDINHSFHFFDSGKGALAESVSINNSQFSNITGDILRLDKEYEDLGIYNAEYVTVKNSQFADVKGAVAKVYRGGTDESTFGPHVTLTNNKFNNVGKGKRNKQNALAWLHGVQVTDIEGNEFKDTAGILVEHTVGEPKTNIENNVYDNSQQPKIIELFAKQLDAIQTYVVKR